MPMLLDATFELIKNCVLVCTISGPRRGEGGTETMNTGSSNSILKLKHHHHFALYALLLLSPPSFRLLKFQLQTSTHSIETGKRGRRPKIRG